MCEVETFKLNVPAKRVVELPYAQMVRCRDKPHCLSLVATITCRLAQN